MQGAEEDERQPEYVVMGGTLVSEDCGLALQLNATATKVEVYYSKAVNYTLMITTLTFIQASRPAPLHRLPSCHLGNTCFPFREPLCQQP